MKILHTADWHIGKLLHKYNLAEDMDLFIDWLEELIVENSIDVILLAGDVFDLANPSAEARRQYYTSLLKIQKTGCKIIMTGGNHDSIHMLNAPQEILSELNIHVVGGMPTRMEDVLIPIGKGDEIEVVVLAIPYLREPELRKATDGDTYESKVHMIQQSIEHIYKEAKDICQSLYPDIPTIAMGHLYTSGAESSDSERDIQIGNQAMFHAKRFADAFDYVALGHIHRPQKITANIPVYYSGSPLPLSFSERSDHKRVLLIDTEQSFQPISIEVPKFRQLIRISGTLAEVKSKLEDLTTPSRLTSLVEIHMSEEQYNAEKILLLDQMISDFSRDGFKIIHRTIHFDNQLLGTGALYDSQESLEDLEPKAVFSKMLESQEQEFEEDTKQGLMEAFLQIVEEVNENRVV